MTASTRSRRLLLALFAIGGPSIAAAACGSSSDHGVVATGDDDGHDSGPISKFDANSELDSSVDGGPDTGADSPPPAPDANEAGGPDAGPPLCNPSATVGSPTLVISTPDPDLLGAVSSDELVIAWTSLPSGGAPVVHWAERATATDSFGAPQTLDASFGPFAPDHVAMSGDGLKLLVVSDDHIRVTEITRAARGAPFDTPGDDFRDVNPVDAGEGPAPGIGPFGSPALSPDLLIWGFTHGGDGLTFAKNAGGGWNVVIPFPDGLVPPGSGPTTMIATGWSADDRTFFYWDSTATTARAVWRDPFSGAFLSTKTQDLGPRQYAFPGGSCAKLYFSAAGDAGGDLDLFVAPLQ
jgi:hypothetical protein